MEFQSTPPLREATEGDGDNIFIDEDFNPRLPCGRRPASYTSMHLITEISIHASLAGGDIISLALFPIAIISIHASLAGGDLAADLHIYAAAISIHASLAGGDECALRLPSMTISFQSTPPLREATSTICSTAAGTFYFNPRLPCGRRRLLVRRHLRGWHYFNPRLPCGRRRSGSSRRVCVTVYFNPRLPCGRRRIVGVDQRDDRLISIHASLAGGDLKLNIDFYDDVIFQSTPPLREATLSCGCALSLSKISIHASLAGGDIFRPDVRR